MSDAPIEKAFQHLSAALDGLEEAIESRLDGARFVEIETELQRIGLDRSRLAQSVDVAEARSAQLEEVNREVSKRLSLAMETIRSVLDGSLGEKGT